MARKYKNLACLKTSTTIQIDLIAVVDGCNGVQETGSAHMLIYLLVLKKYYMFIGGTL